MSDMADVIRIHSQIGRDERGQYCKGCQHRYGYGAERVLGQRACEHVAQELSAAGFGPVQAARAEALRKAAAVGWDAAVAAMTYEDGTPVEVAQNSNPYRTEATNAHD
jgi:hypothetical protein